MHASALQKQLEPRLAHFIDDLRALTGIDCGTHHKAGVDLVGAWVTRRCHANNWDVMIHPRMPAGNIVEAVVPGTGHRRILLLMHMDTVYPNGTVEERPLREEMERLIGPGSCDMKAGLLAGIYAVEALQAIGHMPWGQVILLFTSDEEIGSPESRDLIQARARVCDAALVLEAGRVSGAVVGSRKGVRDYLISVHGRSAHAGVEPGKGRNALLELAHKIVALQALNGAVPGASLNVGVARGGTAANVVPDHAEAQIDVRGTEQASFDEMDRLIREILAAPAVPDTSIEVRQRNGFPPMPRAEATERMIAHAQAVARELGFSIDAVATGGASDASLVAGIGQPVLDGLGPIGGDAHSPTEWVAISSIVPRTAMLGGLIARIAEQGV
jgi:glutamate carboxypeptidase